MGTRVLIVDDSKLARIVIGRALAALQPDWIRVEAGNAKDAIALLDQGGIDVMILDFNMPGEDGLQLAETVRVGHPAMPIALATANIQDEIVMRARAAGVAFIAKPITEDGLRGFVSAATLKLRRIG
jgi:CheY-like chemotaxis protein